MFSLNAGEIKSWDGCGAATNVRTTNVLKDKCPNRQMSYCDICPNFTIHCHRRHFRAGFLTKGLA